MSTILSNNLLVNGLRQEFADTYGAIRNRQNASQLAQVMDLSVPATNRDHDFAYLNAAPHLEYWQRGETIPTDAMDSVQFNVKVYEWAQRVPWSKFDRKDDQTQSLFDMARMAGESAALLEERLFFDLLTNTATNLPAIPNAPDGSAFFVTSARFEDNGGNTITKSGVTTVSDIQADYYSALERFMAFKDGKGQPLFSPETINAGTLIIYPAATTQLFEMAFMQLRQGITVDNTGVRTTGTGGTAASAESNIVRDASRNVELWGTSRLTTADEWYIFLKASPKKPTFILDREGVQEFAALEGDNNSDVNRDTAQEYIQWERRCGAGIALPYGAIKVA